MQSLKGEVAIVTGASRGGGRGIALELGAAGATVYVTGRTIRTYPNQSETINETAAMVTAQGGQGIPVQVDHTIEEQVASLFEQVYDEHGKLDLLVNNIWGGYESYEAHDFDDRFWNQPLWRYDKMFNAGVRAHFTASQHAARLMIPRKSGLIINTTASADGKYLGNLAYDIAKSAINRMAYGMALELREYNIAAIALAPGFMRTEAVLRAIGVNADNWQQSDALQSSESPQYIGRAVVALASDPNVMAKSGQLFAVGYLAKEYGFTDIDGRQVPAFEIPSEHAWD